MLVRSKKLFFKHRFFKLVFSLLYLILTPILIYQAINQFSYAIEINSATSHLKIPTINLSTPVKIVHRTTTSIDVPDHIAGLYQKTNHLKLILGHSSTIFTNLHQVNLNDTINLDQTTYIITDKKTLEKSAIDMKQLLAPDPNSPTTLILMTCAGTLIADQDYTHRLIITAQKINHKEN